MTAAEPIIRKSLEQWTTTDLLPLAEAKQAWRLIREGHDLSGSPALLTEPDGNTKMKKSELPSYGLTLSQAATSGYNTCTSSTPECRWLCLASSGRLRMPYNERVRVARTHLAVEQPLAFATLVWHELRRAVNKHGRIAVRMNVLSDIRWEYAWPSLFTMEGVQFYDYTKHRHRQPPTNYELTFSISEKHTEADVVEMVNEGKRCAMVIDVPATKTGYATELPTEWNGCPAVDGDKSDLRLEQGGNVIFLRAKGKAKEKRGVDNGFVKSLQVPAVVRV